MFAKIKEFYNREDINTGRQKNIDYAKAIAIIGMILIHIMIYPYYTDYSHAPGFFIGYLMGGFMAAPVFMTSMGIGLGYTNNNNSPKKIIIRGAKLVGMNFILNILRSIYPIFGRSIFSDHVLESICFNIFNGDILLFAGLAMILFGLLKFIKKHSNLYIFITAIVLLIISSIFKVINNENLALAYTLGLIIPVNYFEEPVIFFQLFSWFFYVAIGYLLAITIKKIKKLDLFYLILGLVGITLSVSMLLFDYYLNLQQFFITICPTDPEYIAGYGYQIIGLGVVFFQFALFHFVTKITPEKLNKVVYRFSSMINEIYIVSWIIILNISYPILIYFVGEESTKLWPFLISFAIVFPISAVLANLWRNNKAKKIKTKQQLNN